MINSCKYDKDLIAKWKILENLRPEPKLDNLKCPKCSIRKYNIYFNSLKTQIHKK